MFSCICRKVVTVATVVSKRQTVLRILQSMPIISSVFERPLVHGLTLVFTFWMPLSFFILLRIRFSVSSFSLSLQSKSFVVGNRPLQTNTSARHKLQLRFNSHRHNVHSSLFRILHDVQINMLNEPLQTLWPIGHRAIKQGMSNRPYPETHIAYQPIFPSCLA